MQDDKLSREELLAELEVLRRHAAESEAQGTKPRLWVELVERVNALKEDLLARGSLGVKVKRITDGLVNIFGADFARIWVTRPGDRCDLDCVHAKVTEGPHVCRQRNRCLHLMASSGRYTHIDGEVHRRVPFDCYKIGRVASGAEPRFLTNDVANDPRIHNQIWARELGLVSFAGCRLLSDDSKPIGVMALFSKHSISPDEETMLEDLANTTSQVVHAALADEAQRESEAKYRAIFLGSSEGILVADPLTTEFKYANPVVCDMLGYTEDELIGLSVSDIHPREKLDHILAEFQAIARQEKSKAEDIPCLRKDGTIFYANIGGASITIGGLPCNVGFFSDITDRKKAEEALRESEDRYRQVTENSLTGIFIHQDGVGVFVNQRMADMLGYTKEEMIGGQFLDAVHPDDREMVARRALARLNGELAPAAYRLRLLKKTGETIWCEVLATIVEYRGRPALMGNIADITDRKKAEEALQWNETLLRQMASTSPLAYFVVDNHTDDILYFNHRFCEIWGVEHLEDRMKKGELDNSDIIADCIPLVKDVEAFAAAFKPLRNEEDRSVVEDEIKTVDDRTIRRFWTQLRDESDRYYGRFYIFEDISDRRRGESLLRESESRYRALFENSPDGVLIAGVETKRFTHANPSVCRMLGYTPEELRALGVADIHPHDQLPQVIAEFEAQARGEKVVAPNIPCLRKDGTVFYADISTTATVLDGRLCNLGFFRDVTMRKQVEEALREGEERYRELVENSNDIVFQIDTEGFFTFVNRATCRISGYSEAELVGLHFTDLILPEYREETQKFYGRQLVKKIPSTYYEFPYNTKNGEVKWVGQNVQSITRENEIVGFQSIARDITEHKKMEDSLRRNEERFRSLIDQAADAIFVHDFDGRFLDVNQQGCTSLGYTRDELLSMSVTDVDPDAAPRGDSAKFWPNLPATLEARHRRKDGSIFPVEVRLGSIEYGETKVLLAMARDLSNRKEAEEALRKSEERYRILADNALVGVYLHQDTFFVYGNRRLEEILRCTVDELTKMRFWEIFHPDVRETVKARGLARYRGEQEPPLYVSRIVTKDGETRWVEVSAVATEYRGKVATTGALVDITERREAEAALRTSEEFNRRLVHHAPFGILYLAGDGTIEYINPAGNRIAGIPEGQVSPMMGRNIVELPGLRDLSKVQESLRRLLEGEPLSDLEVPYTSSVGRDTVLLVAATPRFGPDGTVTGAILMLTDISDRKRAEELQRQTAHYRAVADLAGGVAHNFNNLLQIVIGNMELALMDLDMGNYTDIRNSLEKVLKSSQFGAETVRRLQSFAGIRDHSQVPERGVFDLSGIVRQAVEMTKTWWKTIPEKQGRKVSLDIHLQDGCLVQCEKNELFEVVVNLVKNATEALTQDGAIEVEASVEGDRVILKIRDTGVGISEQNLKRLFNPFFTTKASAGAGLGLASSRKIIEDYGGNILADGSEGKGTTFTVLLPLARKEPESPGTEKTPATVEPFTVLAIDDEEAILDLLEKALTRRNYGALTALSGDMGLDIFKENPVDLVICDLGMPGMTGWEVGKEIRAICEERGIKKTPFMLLTGWGGQKTEMTRIAESGVDVIIEKPLNIKNMLECVREIAEKGLSRDSG